MLPRRRRLFGRFPGKLRLEAERATGIFRLLPVGELRQLITSTPIEPSSINLDRPLVNELEVSAVASQTCPRSASGSELEAVAMF